MNLDRTFCSGLRCDRTQSCDRFVKNLPDWVKDHPRGQRLSMAQFADHDGKCTMYSKIERPYTDLLKETESG